MGALPLRNRALGFMRQHFRNLIQLGARRVRIDGAPLESRQLQEIGHNLKRP